MGYQKPCVHGKFMCGAMHKGRQFMYGADKVLREHGKDIGKVAQAAAPFIAAANPMAGMVAGAVGVGAEEYSRIRNEIDG